MYNFCILYVIQYEDHGTSQECQVTDGVTNISLYHNSGTSLLCRSHNNQSVGPQDTVFNIMCSWIYEDLKYILQGSVIYCIQSLNRKWFFYKTLWLCQNNSYLLKFMPDFVAIGALGGVFNSVIGTSIFTHQTMNV